MSNELTATVVQATKMAWIDSSDREEAFYRAQLAHQQRLGENSNSILELFERLSIDANDWFSNIQGFDRINFDGDTMLIVTELAEMVEADRTDSHSTKIHGFSERDEEIADALIRIFHLIGKYKLNAGPAFLAKMAYNLNRPFKHGKKY